MLMSAHDSNIAAQTGKETVAPEGIVRSADAVTGETVWQAPCGDPAGAAELAQAHWPHWAARALTQRLEIVRGFINLVRRRHDDLVAVMARETGRPRWDIRAELDQVDLLVDVALRFQSDRAGQRRLEGRSDIEKLALRHKPHGVIAVITPYSSPVLAAMRQIIPALLAGNGVIWKPSPHTSGVADMIVKIAGEATIPEGIFQFLPGGADIGKQLIAAAPVRAVCFTGSAQVGLSLAKQLGARTDKPLALDIGGNNAVIGWDVDDIHAGAVQIVRSAFTSSGQHCSAARRLIVDNASAEPLLAEIKKIAARLIVAGPDSKPTPFMGPVIDNAMADGLSESFLALMSHGGRPIKHLVRPDPNRSFLLPGIVDVTDIADRPDIELFGPLLQVIRVSSFDEAIAETNRTRFHRAAALIGGSQQEFDKFWANSRAMRINWNNLTFEGSPHAPTGGMGLAGNHRPGGSYMSDFVAYPVHSAENESPRGIIGVGLADDAKAAMTPIRKEIENAPETPDANAD